MKKLFLAVMACAALCACSNDDIVVSSSSVAADGDGVAYLTVKISDVGGTTRGTDGGYMYGSTDEQKVNDAYFYLYDQNGNYLAKGSADLGTGTGKVSGSNDGNVEWNSETVVAMWGLTYADITAGTKLLTVLNKPSGIDLTNKTLDDAVALLAGTPYANDDGSFVMSTSVYYDGGTSTLYNYTAVTAGNFAPEPVDISGDYAEGSSYTPVEVYVERLAAKVGVSLDNSLENGVAVPTDQFLVGGADDLKIVLLGWNVDAIARDAYLIKHIDSKWADSAPFSGWNVASDHRSYWAMSPNYDATVAPASLYPYSSNGNTDVEEADSTTWLNDYVAYTSLKSANDFGSYAYCGENAISPSVLNAVDNDTYAYNGLNAATMVTVKAQIQDSEGNPVDIVKWHGEYLPLDTFLADMITEVETYDFEELFALVAAALGEQYTSYGSVIDIIVGYLEPAIYYKESNEFKPFDSSFIYLMNEGDGNVSFWFNSSPSHDTTNKDATHYDHSESGNAIPDYYINDADGNPKTVVKKAAKDMDDYNFYAKFNDAVKDETALNFILTLLQLGGMIEEGATAESDDSSSYFLDLANIKISSSYDWSHDTSGTYYYDGKNFLIRAIDREAAGILDDWAATGYPQLYNSGMMYYYVPIEHLGTATTGGGIGEGQYGVVRNHWYDITITSVSDLGHPIASEDEVIVPTPDIDYYYLGANVNILSWKNITQSVAF